MLCVGHIVGTLQRIGVLNGRIGIIIGKKQGFIFVSGQRRIPSLVQICIRGIDKLITKGNDSMIAVVGKNGSSIPAQLPHGIGNRDIALRIGGIQRQTVGHRPQPAQRDAGCSNAHKECLQPRPPPCPFPKGFGENPDYKNHCRCTCLRWNRKPVHCGQNTDRSFRRSTAECTEKYH